MEPIMIMMSRIEAEMRIRQQELLKEMAREQESEDAKPKNEPAPNPRPIHSQFFAQRFGEFLRRLKTQGA